MRDGREEIALGGKAFASTSAVPGIIRYYAHVICGIWDFKAKPQTVFVVSVLFPQFILYVLLPVDINFFSIRKKYKYLAPASINTAQKILHVQDIQLYHGKPPAVHKMLFLLVSV